MANRLRAPRLILGFVAIAIGIALLSVWVILTPSTQYRRFLRRDARYYSDLGDACDALLRQHPTFQKHSGATGPKSNLLWMDRNDVVWVQARLSGKETSFPAPIRALHPDEVLLAPGRAFIGFGVGRTGWAIIWEQDQSQTNKWTLQSNADGLVKTVYIRTN
jgi:hypothetical protein